MARSGLEESTIPIPFSAGTDTGVDPKLVPAPYLLRAENVEMIKRGKLQKRSTLTAISTAIYGTTDLMTSIRSLRAYGLELIASLSDFAYAYAANISKWIFKGTFIPVTVTVTDVIKNAVAQAYPDACVSGNLGVFAWEYNSGIYAALRDLSTNTTIAKESVIFAAGTVPRCLTMTTVDDPMIFAANGTNILGSIITKATGAIGSPITIKTDLKAASPNFDVVDLGARAACVYNVTGGSTIRFITLDTALAATNRFTISEAADTCLALAVTSDLTTNIYFYVLWYDGTNVRCAIYNGSYVQVVAPFTVETVANVTKITGIYVNLTPTSCRVFYEVSGAASYNYAVRTAVITVAGAVSGVGYVARGVGLISRAFNSNGAGGVFAGQSAGGGQIGGTGVIAPLVDGYVICCHESTQQSTFFMLRNDGKVAAKFQYGKAGGVRAKSVLTSCGLWTYLGTLRLIFGLATKNERKEAHDFSFLSLNGVSQVEINFNDTQVFDGVQAGTEMIAVGGRTSTYDGAIITEQGFNLYPENAVISQTTGGSLTLLGVYSYALVYEWTDNHGRLHRSAPGFFAVTMTGSNNKTSIAFPNLRLTERGANVQLVPYRTENNGTVYYRAGSTTSTNNDTSTDTTTVLDDVSDATLIGREPLYTNGGELENIGAPTAKYADLFGKRVMLAGTEDNTVWPSKQLTEGKPVEFNDQLVLTPSTLGGPITGIKTLDDKFVMFRKNRIEYITGEGPNNIGTGSPFSPPILISNDIGCINARSIMEFPPGLLFQSAKGFFLLNRSLQLFYIGKQVKQWETATVSRAVLLASKNQARITLSGEAAGTALVLRYDMVGEQPQFDWTIFTSYGAKDAVVSNSTFYLLSDASLVYQETEGSFSSSVSMSVITPWISLDNLEGFKRIKEILLLMTYKSAHVLTVKIGYDYSPAWSQTLTFNPSSAAGIVAITDSDYYGIGSFSGDARAPYQLRICPAIQKCAAIRLQISDGTLSGTNEGLSLSGMVLRVATKRGLNKLRAAQSI